MNEEFLRLLDIKQRFGWPVSSIRYGLGGEIRFLGAEGRVLQLTDELRERVRFSLRKAKIADNLLRNLARLPWVQMIFLTGSVASLNAQKQDDIDVWLIVNPRRIWLTRAFDFFIYAFTGKRRLSADGTESERLNDKLCFNFYSTTTALALQEQTISSAMQFVDALPVFVRDFRQYQQLLTENRWIEKYFPSWYKREVETTIELRKDAQVASEMAWPLAKICDILEYVAGVLMLLKAEKRLFLNPKQVFRPVFTTWGTTRILSTYDHETLAKSSQKGQ